MTAPDPRVGLFQLSIDEADALMRAFNWYSGRFPDQVDGLWPLYERLRVWRDHRIAVAD